MGLGKTYSTKYLLDSNNSSGVAGQVLSTTSTGIDWVDANTVPGSGLWLASGNNIYNSNSANVGIGTTSPENILTAKATNCTIDAQSTGDGQTISLRAGYLNSSGLAGYFRYTTGDAQLYIDNNYQGNNGVYSDINIRNRTTGNVLTTRIKIKGSTGNVGIGTTSPNDKLDVTDGNSKMVFGGASSDRPLLYFQHNAVPVDAEEIGLLDFRGYNDASQDTRYVILTAKAEDVTDGSEDGSLTFQTMKDGTATQSMTLRSGNVGIGVTSPGVKLDIDDGAVTDVRIRGNQTSDARIGAYNFYNTAASDVVAAISADRDGANDAAALAFDTQVAGGGMTERMRISSAGAIKFNAYGAGTLVTDASGNITVSSGGGTGGPFLPLAGNTTATAMTGNINIGDNLGINWLSATNAFANITLGTDFTIFVGKSNADLILQNASNDIKILTTGGPSDIYIQASGNILIDDYIVHNGDTNSYFGFGAADEYKVILNNSTKIAADASSAYLYFEGNQMFKTYGDSGTTSGVSVPLGRLYSFDGDTDTGMFSDIANGVNFLCGNNETLRLTSTGATFSSGAGANGDCTVVIAADTDNTVENSNPILQLKQDGGTLNAIFGINGDANNTFTGALSNAGYLKTDGSLQIAPGNLLSTTFATNSNVGIGTNNPLHALEVYGAARNIAITNTTEDDAGIVFRDAQAATDQAAAIKFNSSDNKLKFFVNDEVAQRMVIDTNGNVGIATTNPGNKLEVTGIIEATVGDTGGFAYGGNPSTKQGLRISVSNTGGDAFSGGARIENTSTTNSASAVLILRQVNSNSSSTITQFRQGTSNSGQGALIGFIRLTTTNTIFSTTGSDERLKKNITNWTDDTLGKFKALQPKKFRYKIQDASEEKTSGFIAQNEVANFPEAYVLNKENEEDDAMYSFNPMGMTTHLMKAIKDLVEKVEILENKITQLEN